MASREHNTKFQSPMPVIKRKARDVKPGDAIQLDCGSGLQESWRFCKVVVAGRISNQLFPDPLTDRHLSFWVDDGHERFITTPFDPEHEFDCFTSDVSEDDPKAFDIRIQGGAYCVSIPDYEGGKVVRYEDYANIKRQHNAAVSNCEYWMAEATRWKASHDNQVELKRMLTDRPDLKERSKSMMKLLAERDLPAKQRGKAIADGSRMMDERDELLTEVERLKARVTDLTGLLVSSQDREDAQKRQAHSNYADYREASAERDELKRNFDELSERFDGLTKAYDSVVKKLRNVTNTESDKDER